MRERARRTGSRGSRWRERQGAEWERGGAGGEGRGVEGAAKDRLVDRAQCSDVAASPAFPPSL
eukprot:1171925-Pyramimonas_sp.AAC.1